MAYNTICLKSLSERIVKELVANAALTPGMLVEEMSTGKVRKHAGDDAFVTAMFALEDELQGKEISEAYAADDIVKCWYPQHGEEVYALLADGENASIGSKLSSNGDGYLRVYASPESAIEETGAIVAIAKEAVNRSTSSGGDTNVTGRIRVEII